MELGSNFKESFEWYTVVKGFESSAWLNDWPLEILWYSYFLYGFKASKPRNFKKCLKGGFKLFLREQISWVHNAVKGNVLITSTFCLQFPTQNSLAEGMIPVFYHDKIPARTGEARNAVLLSILQWIKHLMCIILPSDFDKLIQTSFHHLEVKVARFSINFTWGILQKLNLNITKWNKISSLWLEIPKCLMNHWEMFCEFST